MLLAMLLMVSLCITAFADQNGINFGVSVRTTDEMLTVTIAGNNAAAFEELNESDKYFTFTTACAYPDAYAVHKGALVTSQLAEGEITISVNDSGDYQIINGTGPVIVESDGEITVTVSQQNDLYLDTISIPCDWSNVSVKLDEISVQATVTNSMVTIPVNGAGNYIVTASEENQIANRVTISAVELSGQTSVWIDGVEYAVQTDGSTSYIDLPDGNARTMIGYTYHVDDAADIHTQYPVSMKVWDLANEDGVYTATHIEELDDILQYSGSSIRITGRQGIRMITSIEKSKKDSLISDGLTGYTLKEYGTVVAWASQLEEDKPLVLGKSYAKSNYAYKKGVADPVFAYSGDLMQYTNVLVGFSLDQCKDDIAMRPYMILEDAEGKEITLYGGIVQRSIGYIAKQNANTFDPVTQAGACDYVWNIIRHVYGEDYVPQAS